MEEDVRQIAPDSPLFVKLFVDGPLGAAAARLDDGRPPGVLGAILGRGACPSASR